jgi:hypothetical protein
VQFVVELANWPGIAKPHIVVSIDAGDLVYETEHDQLRELNL